jgi:condensin complex subunit 1
MLQARHIETTPCCRVVNADIRNNIVIALGDLLLRWPNTLEPWTGHMYAILNDPDTSVRSNTLMVLSHLVLNDMMKVKGHISRICLCLQDPEPQVRILHCVISM